MSSLLGLEEERPAGAGSQYESVPAGPNPAWIAQAKRGANWFYWIAGLSLVNSILFVTGAKLHFLAGLGLTEIVDVFVDVFVKQGLSPAFRVISIGFDLIFVIGFALCGYYANKLFKTVFILGIIVYAFDALIVLLLGDFLMVAFHGWALYSLIRGFLACRNIAAFQRSIVIPLVAQPMLTPPGTP
ncbi:MAG: hypothetical protein ABI999_04760 [Acidobacteriota bacterium]